MVAAVACVQRVPALQHGAHYETQQGVCCPRLCCWLAKSGSSCNHLALAAHCTLSSFMHGT